MAKDNETFGIGMATETATLDSGIRQPSVNYQATVRMPDVNISTGDVKLPSTDWASYALNEGNRLLQGYEKWQESDAKAKAAAAKQAEDEADLAQRNALARAINKIEAGRRQGLYNNTVAESMLRDLEDQAIASGMDEDTVTKVRKNRQTDILSIETERRKAEQTHEINVSNELDNELIKKYPVTATMTKAERLNYITRADKAITTYQNMEREKRLYPVDSDEYKIRDTLQAQAAEEDAEINLCLKISQAINADKKVTPETLAALKEEAVNYYTYNFGMNPTKAAIMIDRIYQLRGADTMQQNYIDSNKLHIEALEDAIKTADLETEYKMYSFPFYTQMKHMYGDKFKEYAADYAERNGIIDTFSRYFAINAGLAAETLDDKGRPTLNTSAIGDAIKGMNNLYAAPSITTPYQRSVTALEVFRSLNNNNSVVNATSERDVKIANNNLKEAKNRMDYDAIRKDAEGLLKSEDPFMSKLGRVTIEELDRAEGQEIASDFRMPNSPMYQTVNSLLSSLNAGEIKYDESGKAFLSGTSGFLGDLGLAFRGVGGEGSYLTQLNRLNESLEGLTPEVKKQTLEALGFKHAVRGEFSALGSRDGVPQTIDRGEQGAELYTFEDGTVARNETGVEATPKNLPRSLQQTISDLQQTISDWWNKQNFAYERPVTTTSKLSSSSSQTYDIRQPSVFVEPESAEGEKLTKELEQIDLAIQGPEGSKDSLNDIIDRYNRNGWDASIFEQERDRLLQRRHEIEKALYYDPEEDTEPTTIDSWLGRYANEYGVDFRQVAAILDRESKGDAKAVSPAGAKGLMQLMPDTFEEIKKELGLPKDADIFDPETNIKAGVYYFSKMMKQFGGDVNKALAAYNWGPGNVSTAIKQYGDDWFEGARTKGIKVRVKGKDVIRKLPKETLNYVSALGQMYA